MLKIGFTNIMPSIVPILVWTILSRLYGNDIIAQGFSITYPYQFLYMGLYAITIRGQIKSEAKEHCIGNKSNSGVLVYLFLSTIVISLSYMFRKEILGYFKFDYNLYTSVLMYGIIIIVCDYTVFCITLIQQYKENHKEAFMTNICWYSLRVLIAVIVSMVVPNYNNGLYVISVVQVFLLTLLLLKKLRFSKFGISIVDGIKYTMSELPHDVLMCMIYATGYNKAASQVGGYFAAYNIEALCTDTQWDILDSGIDTAVTTDICENGDVNQKKSILASVVYSIILFASSAVTITVYSMMYKDVDIRKVITIFLVECGGFPIYAIMYCVADKIVISNPTALIAILGVVRYAVRFIVTSMVVSPYAISYGVVTSCVLGLVQWFIIYKYVNRKDKYNERYRESSGVV